MAAEAAADSCVWPHSIALKSRLLIVETVCISMPYSATVCLSVYMHACMHACTQLLFYGVLHALVPNAPSGWAKHSHRLTSCSKGQLRRSRAILATRSWYLSLTTIRCLVISISSVYVTAPIWALILIPVLASPYCQCIK